MLKQGPILLTWSLANTLFFGLAPSACSFQLSVHYFPNSRSARLSKPSGVYSPILLDRTPHKSHFRLSRKTSMSTSMNQESTPQNEHVAEHSMYPTLKNKNLVSVQDCLEALDTWKKQKQEQQYSSSTNDKATESIVFIDASWYHKGGRNGREE